MINAVKTKEFQATRERPSANFNTRKADNIHGVVLHATGGSDEGAESWMANVNSGVSCHLHIRRDGSVTRMVNDIHRAWHAGRSEWRHTTDVNSITLGWEIGNLNNGIEPYTDLQYGVVAQIAVHYIRQGLTINDFVSHEEVARPVGRKDDPRGFDWPRFRREVQERLKNGLVFEPATQPGPLWVWSEYFQCNLIVTQYNSDNDWRFVTEHDVNGVERVAQTPFSRMPKARR